METPPRFEDNNARPIRGGKMDAECMFAECLTICHGNDQLRKTILRTHLVRLGAFVTVSEKIKGRNFKRVFAFSPVSKFR